MSRRPKAAIAGMALALLSGCAPKGGVVTQSYRNSDGKNWTVCAEKGSESGCNVMTSVSDGPRCQIGEIYPDCLKIKEER
jgi:hypothetical protein